MGGSLDSTLLLEKSKEREKSGIFEEEDEGKKIVFGGSFQEVKN